MVAIVASAVLALLSVVVYRHLLGSGVGRLLLLLRLLTVGGLGLVLGGMVLDWTRVERSRHIAFLVDRSASITAIGAESVASSLAESVLVPSGFRRDIWVFADSTLPVAARTEPGAGRTRFGRALRRVLATRPAAVVLISDGQDNDDEPLVTTNLTAPVYTIGLGPPQATNLAIDEIIAPATASVGDSIRVAVRFRATTDQPRRVAVRLGSEVRQAELGSGTADYELPFVVRATSAGILTLVATIESVPGEVTYHDNIGSTATRVAVARVRVAYNAGRPGPSSRMILAALRADERVSLRRTSLLTETDVESADVFILDEPTNNTPTSKVTAAIRRRVYGGAGLMLITGPGMQFDTELESLLGARPGTVERRSTPVEATAVGRMLSWLPDPTTLAPFTIVMPLRTTRPGSETWLAAVGSGQALLQAHSYGRGRVVYCAGYPLWRWGFADGSSGVVSPLASLLSGIIRYLAQGSGARFELAPVRSLYHAGEPVVLTFRALAVDGSGLERLDVRLRYWRQDAANETLATVLTEIGAGSYLARLTALAPGRYQATAVARAPDSIVGQASTEFVVLEQSLELSRLGRNRSLLVKIATASGGQYWPSESLPASEVFIKPLPRQRRVVFDFRRLPLVFVTIALLAIGEWLLRRRQGLL